MDKQIKEQTVSMPTAITKSQALVAKGYAIKIFDDPLKLSYIFILWKHIEKKRDPVSCAFRVNYTDYTDFLSKSAPDFYKRFESVEEQLKILTAAKLGMLMKLTQAIESAGKVYQKPPKVGKKK